MHTAYVADCSRPDAARIAGAFLSHRNDGAASGACKDENPRWWDPVEIPQERAAALDALQPFTPPSESAGRHGGVDQRGCELADEGSGSRVLQLLPSEAEVHGLLALMLHCEARRAARRGPDGRYVPLSEQDPKLWSLPLIEDAEGHLAEAFENGRFGRFQLEAAIQSVHAERARSGRIEWEVIVGFYEQLIRVSPTLGTQTGYAAAVAEAVESERGLAVLDAIDSDAVSRYQPYWAVRAHLLQRLGRTSESADAFDRAIGLVEDQAVRQFLLRKSG